jgi:hypothetical protein
MSDQQQRITLAQSVNLAKDIAIAQRGNDVTVDDVANLVEEVYVKLFKETCNRVARNTSNKASSDVDKFIKEFASAADPIAFRNENKELLASFSKADRDKILTAIGE